MNRARAIVVVALGGCQQLLDLERPERILDAATTDDVVAVDSARECPAAPTGCKPFRCAATSSCYYECGIGSKQTWTSAQASCNSGLGCMATIDSQDELDCLGTQTNGTFSDLVWFGWRQDSAGAEPGGGWGWECGAITFVATNWGNFEPNDTNGNEDCAALVGNAWIDYNCATPSRFLCEVP